MSLWSLRVEIPVITLSGKTYIRNVKHLTHAPTDTRTLFDDEKYQQVVVDGCDKGRQVEVDQPQVVRTRSGRVS